MADYLKSAFNYLANSSTGKNENEFLGSNISVGSINLRIKRVIAEGGYGVVYEAQDTSKGTCYALKKQLSGHPNIMRFHYAASVGKEKMKVIGTEFLILTELCKGGQLTQYLPAPRQEKPFSVRAIIQIMHQTCRAVQHMHNQCPPVMHRDLKVENLLFSDKFVIKLCDFGSASTTSYSPDQSWSALKRISVQEELEKTTTPMYRAPEMLDLYQNHPINTASDIWALGCIFFYLTCTHHPFEDSAKLAILNANYSLPASAGSNKHNILHGLIRQMLLIDPRQRPSIVEVLGELSELASMRELSVSGPIPILEEVKQRRGGGGGEHATRAPPNLRPDASTTVANEAATIHLTPSPSPRRHKQHANQSPRTHRVPETSKPTVPPHRPLAPPAKASAPPMPPNPPSHAPTSAGPGPPIVTSTSTEELPPSNMVKGGAAPGCVDPNVGAPSGNMFGMLRGGAGNLFRNIREASNKVLESVSATLTAEVDLQLITSRIAVMSYPAETGIDAISSGNSMEEAQVYLQSRYPNVYAVYNVSNRPYRSERAFDGRYSHRIFESHRAPALRSLFELCLNARLWLSQRPENVCVVHCTDGRALSAILVCSLLCLCRLFDNVSPALQLYSARRGNPRLNASQIRYIDYVAQMVHNRVSLPHHRPLKLISLTVAPIPTFNKSKNGCRPYVEVYEGKTRVFSTLTDYENLRSYMLEDEKIEFLLNGVSVMGDLTVIVYHCRSSFVGRTKVAAVKIAQFQLYTGFVDSDQTELIYFRSDLDHLDTTSGFGGFSSRYAESFRLTLEFMVSPDVRTPEPSSRAAGVATYPWENLPPAESLRPEVCISSTNELKMLMSDFGRFNVNPPGSSGPSPAASSRQASDAFVDPVLVTPESHPDSPSHVALGTEKNTEDSPSLAHRVDAMGEDPSMTDSTVLEHVFVDVTVTPVADLLGFNLTAENSHPDSNTESDAAAAAPQRDTSNKPYSSDLPTDLDPKSSFVDNLFDLHSADAGNDTSDDWTAAFNIPATTTTSSKPHQSTNPFDPFGTPTVELPPLFDVTGPEDAGPSRESKSTQPQFSNVGTGPEDFVAAHLGARSTATEDPDFDILFAERVHLSASVSASNLSAKTEPQLHPSASFTSLGVSDDNGAVPQTPAAAAARPTRLDPFADLDDLFGKPVAAGVASPVDATSSDPMGSSGDKTPRRSSKNTKSTHPAPPTFSQHNSSWSNFANPAQDSTTNTSTGQTTPNTSAPRAPFPPPPSTPNRTGTRPRVGKDTFSDLLGGFGASTAPGSAASSNADGTKTVNQMRRELLEKTTDPDEMKVQDWAHGKDRNLRALLCSLPIILWDGVRWKPVGIGDLMGPDQVKRQYRNAARAIHPDKWMNTEHEKLARMIFVELNDAMAEFEKEPNPIMSY